ncbi:DEAD/DEAH box helicase [Latilactobacillus graminis]|uniref:DEAD DEAH box helicase family protein n=2 Tax=Latilactobacillus graminis TaxID=60519 RepID=A0AA89HZC7_9LACO|nr:helicase-related protein [Latilactobacillus graminis]KRM20665.1 DEAD DEAH box helicase family protein [Latilactobacillus graminis DSM 20719]
MIEKQLACGRQWSATQFSSVMNNYSLPQIKQRPAFQKIDQQLVCQRCHQVVSEQTCLPDGRYYCAACLMFGRLVEGDQLVYIPEENQFATVEQPLTWSGTLTAFQAQAAEKIVTVVTNKQQHVLTAVTGAGKTEMLFSGIATALARGQRVCVAAPRVAVCLELYPRLQTAFAKTPSMLMYGTQTAPYMYTPLVVCTTHQLFKFYHAFDTVIVDEVDAFPYVNNPLLATAVKQACKPHCALIYLTATPTAKLRHAINIGQLTESELPIRFHGHLLPEPHCRPIFRWRQTIKRHKLPRVLQALIQDCLKTQRLLLFVPQVHDLEQVRRSIVKTLPKVAVATVHASDPDQLAKIAAFRSGTGDILITTTVLERGVTLKNVAVFVLGAEHIVFNEAVLVQIAGRAGRDKAYAANLVYFFYTDYTLAIKRACQQIKYQNQKGRRLQSTVRSVQRP